MSELLFYLSPFYLSPIPVNIPIISRGNAFWRDGERCFVKGIGYTLRKPGDRSYGPESRIDPLTEDRLRELEKDIALVHNLGLNSISVTGLDPSKDHAKALELLEKEGIYVVVTIFHRIERPQAMPKNKSRFKPNSDTWPMYDLEIFKDTFRLFEQLSRHPNILGFMVSGDIVNSAGVGKMAEVLRACIRDTKALVRAHGVRKAPVGISACDVAQIRIPSLKYFSAGAASERADFVANQCYSWVDPSSFQISGWRSMVAAIERATRVPMLLVEYGTNIRRPRVWDEVLCLFSPDMTGVHSGGFAYTLFEYGSSYGVAEISEGGGRMTTKDFENLKRSFTDVNCRSAEEVATAEVTSYEECVGGVPESSSVWKAAMELPPFPGNWEDVISSIP